VKEWREYHRRGSEGVCLAQTNSPCGVENGADVSRHRLEKIEGGRAENPVQTRAPLEKRDGM